MIEIAIGFLSAYLARKAGGLLNRAGTDVDQMIDGKLEELYEFTKSRLLRMGRRGERSLQQLEQHPDDQQPRRDALEDLSEILQQDPHGTAELQALLEELQQLDPHGVYLRGTAQAHTVQAGASSTGVDVEGRLQPGDTAEGTATTTTVHGEQAGVRYRPNQPPQPPPSA